MSVPRDFIPALQLVTNPRDMPINATTAAMPTEIPTKVNPVRTGRRTRPRAMTLKNVISLVSGRNCRIAVENNVTVLHLEYSRRAARNAHIVRDEHDCHAPLAVDGCKKIENFACALAVEI